MKKLLQQILMELKNINKKLDDNSSSKYSIKEIVEKAQSISSI